MEQILPLLKKSDFLETVKGVLVSKHPRLPSAQNLI